MDYQDIDNKFGVCISISVPGTSAATSTNYPFIITARYPMEVTYISEKHETAGSDVGTVTLDIVKVADGSAISTGSSVLLTAFNLKAAANTLIEKSGTALVTTTVRGVGYRQIQQKDSFALKTSGTLTAVAGVHVNLYLMPLGRGAFR